LAIIFLIDRGDLDRFIDARLRNRFARQNEAAGAADAAAWVMSAVV
jgi:hypothetical protein